MMSKILTQSILRYQFCHGVQGPQNMKKFFKEAYFIENTSPAHPFHKYKVFT